jgi:hypothetical protein
MANRFTDFINRNTVSPSGDLPMVHSTHAYYLRHIRDSDAIIPQPCEVFSKNVSYFFFGRPAYKVPGDAAQAQEWELPACFVFDYQTSPTPIRVYPFDTGAHHARRMPHYIGMIGRDEFETSSSPDAPKRIVGAFFSDVRSYFKSEPKGLAEFRREFSPGVFDAEVKAVHRLALADSSALLDDRKMSVEAQVETTVDLKVTKPIAVVAPLPYCEDAQFRQHVTTTWGAQLISYPVNSLSVANFHGLIYERVERLYTELGLL